MQSSSLLFCTMDNIKLCSAIVAAQQIHIAIIFNNIPTQHEVRVEKKRKWEAAPYKCNFAMHSGPPETVQEPLHILDSLLADDNCEYIKKSQHSWQFFLLAGHLLKDCIERPRDNNQSLKSWSHTTA
jgi:hypothetical protein